MDEINIATCFSIVKDVLLAIAACITACVAHTGLKKWREELQGKANFDVARELAKSTYILRDAISLCRSPFIVWHEFPEDYDPLIVGDALKKGRALAYVYENRWAKVSNAMQSFDLASIEAEALWSGLIKDKTHRLRKCAGDLKVDIDSYIRNEFAGGTLFVDADFEKEVKLGIWDHSKENPLTTRINDAISDIETEIRPHLSRVVK
jgi:hypothetical protein